MPKSEAEELDVSMTLPEGITTEEEAAPQYSDVEIEAMELGWNPEGAEGKRNLSAEEFIDRKPLYDKMHRIEQRAKRTEESLLALQAHQGQVRKMERDKVMNELNARKKEAVEVGDGQTVVDIDDRLAAVRAEEQADEAKPAPNPVFETWVEDNPWYSQDEDMKDYADMIGNNYHTKHPKKPLTDVYAHVLEEVKIRYEDKFKPAPKRHNPVEGASRQSAAAGSKHSVRELPPEAQHIMRTLVRNGTLTEEQYLADYFDEES